MLRYVAKVSWKHSSRICTSAEATYGLSDQFPSSENGGNEEDGLQKARVSRDESLREIRLMRFTPFTLQLHFVEI